MRRILLLLTLTLPATAQPVRLPTGVFLDPAAPAQRVGSMPIAAALDPKGERVALLLSGWREQGVQIVDAKSGALLQTLEQPAAFAGIAFAPDGNSLWASGGNEDAVYRYDWNDGAASNAQRIELAKKENEKEAGKHYPAGLALSPDGKRLYVAENLSDTVAVVDTASGAVLQRVRTDRYPYAVVAGANGAVYVSSWGDETVVEFRAVDAGLQRRRRIKVGRHPSSMLLHGERLYVTCASIDEVVAIDVKRAFVAKRIRMRVVDGTTPNALAISNDGTRLFAAEADANAVAVIDLKTHQILGRIPTEWYPTALAFANGKLLVVTGKGNGTAPNPQRAQPNEKEPEHSTQYTLGQLNGSVMLVDPTPTDELTQRVMTANHWDGKREPFRYPAFQHVIYVIKENRTYDQMLGDLPQGDGDASLTYFPRAVSPNHHALAERFGVFDRFFVNAEVSAQGHNWSTAAYTTDYTEKTTPSHYSDRGRTYDYEGANRGVAVDDDDDVAAPAHGYLWDLAARKGLTLRNYGEFVDEHSVGVRRALRKTTNPDFPPYDLDIPDQKRADVWIADLEGFTRANAMPALQIVRLPNDHTAGGAPDKPTPKAYVADNDLALGRIVAALSRSPFWKDTVMFVLEDDAQNGPDHVDSHRSPLLVISPYNRAGVVHRFANTTDVLATIEEILGLGSLTHFDRFGRPLREVFAQEADLAPYDALRPEIDLDERNPAETQAAKETAKIDLRRDAADEDRFNRILWAMLKGDAPYPGAVRAPLDGRLP
ncbi:MAG: bifunctional YncE family protein/alkaline phosphatase family protein [Acidobacteria bacterium]|nr:bifunctional YncE family protein/alkaline phosphatase family protein [Acidobacteriota bacterium]